MRVAIITPRYPPNVKGGGEISAQLLAENLMGYGESIDDVVIFSFDGTGHETIGGIEVRRLKRINTPVTELQNVLAYRVLSNKLSEFDVVHAYNMELNPLVGYLASRGNVPSVATLNSYHFFPKSVTNVKPSSIEQVYERVSYPTTGRVLRLLMKQIGTFVAISNALKDIYNRNGFNGSRIEHVPNMIDPSFSVPSAQNDSDGFQLLYVGALEEHKGVRNVIRAMRLLPEDVRLRVVGGGREGESLERVASELGVDARVDFVGRLPYTEIPQQYTTADAFVHPGIWPEPFGRTILEAMQAGLPVVCTNIGGPPEIVPDSDLICEPGNPADLASAIRKARQKNSQRAAEESQNEVQSRYHPSVVIPNIEKIYESVL